MTNKPLATPTPESLHDAPELLLRMMCHPEVLSPAGIANVEAELKRRKNQENQAH